MSAWFHQNQDVVVQTQDLESELEVFLDSANNFVSLTKSQMYDSLNLNSTQITYMNQAFNMFYNKLSSDQDTINYLDTVVSAFNNFENVVLYDNSLDSSQKVIILMTSSVLKHSFCYWNSNLDFFYNSSYGKRNFQFLWSWNWGKALKAVAFVAESDAVGALAGAIAAGIAAAPVNVVPAAGQITYGAAIGYTAVGTGVGNSILDAYNKWGRQTH